MTAGHRLFCKEFLHFSTMPCRRTPLLVHFRKVEKHREANSAPFAYTSVHARVLHATRETQTQRPFLLEPTTHMTKHLVPRSFSLSDLWVWGLSDNNYICIYIYIYIHITLYIQLLRSCTRCPAPSAATSPSCSWATRAPAIRGNTIYERIPAGRRGLLCQNIYIYIYICIERNRERERGTLV